MELTDQISTSSPMLVVLNLFHLFDHAVSTRSISPIAPYRSTTLCKVFRLYVIQQLLWAHTGKLPTIREFKHLLEITDTIITTTNKSRELMSAQNTLSGRFSMPIDFKALYRHSTSPSASAFVGFNTWRRSFSLAEYRLVCKRESQAARSQVDLVCRAIH